MRHFLSLAIVALCLTPALAHAQKAAPAAPENVVAFSAGEAIEIAWSATGSLAGGDDVSYIVYGKKGHAAIPLGQVPGGENTFSAARGYVNYGVATVVEGARSVISWAEGCIVLNPHQMPPDVVVNFEC